MRVIFALCCALVLTTCSYRATKLGFSSNDQQLRPRPPGSAASSPLGPPILILALDGVSRDQLYAMIRGGELPSFTALLGGDDLRHAYFDPSLLSTLPSTTMAAWVSAMTGATPAETGVTGNEYFVRETRKFECPAPVSFQDPEPTLSIYTDHYLDTLVDVPTVYEQLREKEPDILIWVAANHLFRGADRLLVARTAALLRTYGAFILDMVGRRDHRHSPALYGTIDRAAFDVLIHHLAKDTLPDVMTMYVSGTDLYAHVASEGPDAARRLYLRTVVEPQVGRLVEVLKKRGVLDRMWVVLIADHGHTEIVHDKVHALGSQKHRGASLALNAAGFRVRPFRHHVSLSNPFSAVLAYGGAMAYVYLADRSYCPEPGDVCPWTSPPRYEQDVLPAAESFFLANRDGANAPELKGTLDMILVRRPRPFYEVDLPFEVYVGAGMTVPVEDYLRDHPHPTYVAFPERLRELAVGTHGERAGDILLLSHFGDVERPDQRYYFARQYHSWHGSPSYQDSAVPLIVANRRHKTEEIGAHVDAVLGDRPHLARITDLLLAIRGGALGR